MNFSDALNELKNNKKVYRSTWNGINLGKKMYLHLQVPDINSKMNSPYIYLTTGQLTHPDQLVPWLASQTDLLDTDWEIYE